MLELLTMIVGVILTLLGFIMSISQTPVIVSSKSSSGFAVKELTMMFSLVSIVSVLETFPSLSAHTNVIIYV